MTHNYRYEEYFSQPQICCTVSVLKIHWGLFQLHQCRNLYLASGRKENKYPLDGVQKVKMKQVLFAFVILCVLCIWVKGDCKIQGNWECSGGTSARPIQGMNFGDDEDDDTFSLFLHTSDCTVMQDGDYSIDDDDVSVDLNGFFDNCETSGGSTCTCFNDFHMTISGDCLDITGPHGEQCQPARGNLFPFICLMSL